MIVEQAFYNLPEVLAGYGFPSQEYEGGIVGAFSLALLQELNGRGVNNPISLMQLERPFRKGRKPWKSHDDRNRYLRCDLHLNTQPIGAGSRRLSAYGWRHSNWTEAKFFRAFTRDGKPKQSSNQAVNTGELLADIIRLLTLVPHETGKKDQRSVSGRYLLHVYLSKPENHISTNWRQDGQNVIRPWIDAITAPGRQTMDEFVVADETDGIRRQVGRPLRRLSFEMTTTNCVIKPLTLIDGQRQFACYLTRIDAFRVSYEDHWRSLDFDRNILESSDSAYKEISEFVASHISLTSELEEQKPSPDEADGENEHAEDGEDAADANL